MSLAKFKMLAVGLAAVVGAGVLPKADGQNPIKVTAGAGTRGFSVPTTLAGWGTVTDPDGDCKFTFAGKSKLTIGIPGKDHALGVERGQMNAPRVLQDADGDFIAQVKVSGEYPQGARSLVEDRRPFHGAGLLLWVDAKNFVRLERAELVTDDRKNRSYVSFELRKGGEFVRAGHADEMPLAAKEAYLRLERRGGKVYGSASADGAKWAAFTPIVVDLPKRVQVGVCAGHNTSSAFSPAFEELKLFVEK